MRVGILGASGFVGAYLRTALEARGDDVVTASLRDPAAAAKATRECAAVVNLAGESIAQRWTPEVKARLRESRVGVPRRYIDALSAYEQRPSVYVSASAIGYYGTSETQTFTEESAPGDDFLAKLCAEWEATAERASTFGIRVATVRTGIVLGPDGGMLAKIRTPFGLGLGGNLGNGRQWMSWIHIADLVALYLLAIDDIAGPLNATAPNPVTNAEFTQTMGNALHRPAIVPVPSFALRAIFGEGADVMLTGQRVVPTRAESLGFVFAYPELKGALEALLHPGA